MNALMNDVKQLTHDVRMKLAVNEDERQLITNVRHIKMLKDLTALTAVNSEVAYFNANTDQFRYNTFAAFINEKSAKYTMQRHLAPDGVEIDKILTYVAHFYKGAELRNTVLVENLLREMDRNGQREAALLTGGYHSQGIVEELKKRGISYMVVTPKIDNPEANAAYAQKMMGQLIPLSPQLVGNINLLVTAPGFSDPEGIVNLRQAMEILMNCSVVQKVIEAFKDQGTEIKEAVAMEIIASILEELPKNYPNAESVKNVVKDLIFALMFDPSLTGRERLLKQMEAIDAAQFKDSLKRFARAGSDLENILVQNITDALLAKAMIRSTLMEGEGTFKRVAGDMLFDLIMQELGGRVKYQDLLYSIKNSGQTVHILIDSEVTLDEPMERVVQEIEKLNTNIKIERNASPQMVENISEAERVNTFVIAGNDKLQPEGEYAALNVMKLGLDLNDQNSRVVFHSMLMALVNYAMKAESERSLENIEPFVVKDVNGNFQIRGELLKSIEQTRNAAQIKMSA